MVENSTSTRVCRVALVLSLALLMLALGCGDNGKQEIEVEALTIRDLLGHAPSHHTSMSEEAQQLLKDRVEAEVEIQGTQGWLGEWTDPHSSAQLAGGEAPYHVMPEDALNSMRRLDGWRELRGEDAWLFGVFLQDTDGAQTFSCPLDFASLEPRKTRADAALPRGWEAVEDFDNASADEQRRLRSLADTIESWRASCLSDRDIPEAEGWVRVVRQERAPFLLAYWPQRNSVYINPALLVHWGEGQEAASPAARTVRQAQGAEGLDGCVERVTAQCTKCTPEYTSANPSECQPSDIYPGTPLFDDCEALRFNIPDGVTRFCVDDILKQPTVLGCFQSESSAELCGSPPATVAIGDTDTLSMYFAGFSDGATRQLCRQVLDACTSPSTDEDGDGIADGEDKCPGTEAGQAVELDEGPFRGCGPTQCPPGRQCALPDPNLNADMETNCEQDCWYYTLNDTGCNDCLGGTIGFDLIWWDPERPEIRDTCTENSQPTTCCGDQAEGP